MSLTKEEIEEINSMSYQQLLEAFKKEGFSTSGSTKALGKKLSKEETTEINSSTTKQQKKSVADDLICPISRELPFDPVHAADGQLYERPCIEEYFATKDYTPEVKSPVKGRMMGLHLLPAPHIKNIIETLIENGQITGDLADNWLEKAKEKKSAEEWLKKAENGDACAMMHVGNCYGHGDMATKIDMAKAFHWYQKACSAGNLTAMAKVGEFLIEGFGVEENRQKGADYLRRGLEKGSELAAFLTGWYLADGLFGFDHDVAEAKRLLKKSLEPNINGSDLNEDACKDAQELLDELVSRSG